MALLTKKEKSNIYTLPFQRKAVLRNSLVESMKKWGFLGSIIIIKTNIIDGNEKLYIIDGQHRYLAAEYLKLDINANILTCNNWSIKDLVELVAKLNSTGVSWNNADYIKAYASLGLESYKIANELLVKCNRINISGLLSYVFSKKSIQNGTLSIDKTFKNKIIGIDSFLKEMPKISAKDIRNLYFVWELANFNTEVFKNKYLANIKELRILTDEQRLKIFKSWFIN